MAAWRRYDTGLHRFQLDLLGVKIQTWLTVLLVFRRRIWHLQRLVRNGLSRSYLDLLLMGSYTCIGDYSLITSIRFNFPVTVGSDAS